MPKNNKNNKIIFSGGGTGGSVTPLLAVASTLRELDPTLSLVFVGTSHGPEEKILASYKIKGEAFRFISIPAGKWRRYFSWKNFSDIFKIIYAFFVSLRLLAKEKPDLVLSAGGFVSVPLVLASGMMNIPVIIHQQDARAGLANRLMAASASIITTTFEKSLEDYGPKAQFIGNPYPDMPSESYLDKIKEKFKIRDDKALLLVSGGGTGSAAINSLVYCSVPELEPRFQIIHITGKGKGPDSVTRATLKDHPDYQSYELLSSTELFALFKLADLVVSRCGLATLTELSALGKPTLLIPMPNSHQEDNAFVFSEAKAAILLHQETLISRYFVKIINKTYQDRELRESLSKNISTIIKSGADKKMAELALGLIEDRVSKRAKL